MKAQERLTPAARELLREAILQAGGNEVLAIGRLDGEGRVHAVRVAARGDASAVPALRPHLEQGDVVIHNHPGGTLTPSAPDLQIAAQLGNQGIGFYIVDNPVQQLYAVAEAVRPRQLTLLATEQLAGHLEPGGALSAAYEAYESRDSQVAMLRFVSEAFNRDEIRVAEAGTGVGKSLAYLIPAVTWVLQNDERVVVSTATINLQQQLVEKDIPLAVRLVGEDPGCYLVKGRGNYLCQTRLQEALEESSLFEEENDELAAIRGWAAATPTGSRSELPFYPDAELWSRVCSEADACHGLRCANREGCFVLKARREAAAARLLVANHHLLFSDLGLRVSGMGFDSAAVLPPFQRIVFDEAHNVEKSATSYFSESFSRFQVAKYAHRLFRQRGNRRRGLLLGLERVLGRSPQMAELRRGVAEVVEKAEVLDALALRLLGEEASLRLRPGVREEDTRVLLLEPLVELAAAAAALAAALETLLDGADEELQENFFLYECRLQLRRLLEVGELCRRFPRHEQEPGEVFWLERRRSYRGEPYVRFVITPLEVAPLMREAVYEPHRSVIFTSATLTVGGSFDYWKRRVGLDRLPGERFAEAIFPSPFDYEHNVFLGIPAEAPEPDQPRFGEFVGAFTRQALEISEGRALVLFTSYALLEQTYAAVAPPLAAMGIPVLRQGEDERHRLLERFREVVPSVLLATDSFWEGVDAPGRALEVLILSRLPFRVPTDPVLAARTDALQARGGNPFTELSLPDAIIRLKQGFGRLMRRQDDRGAVLILDSRIVRRRYGAVFLASLPPARTVVSSEKGVLEAFESFIVAIRRNEERT